MTSLTTNAALKAFLPSLQNNAILRSAGIADAHANRLTFHNEETLHDLIQPRSSCCRSTVTWAGWDDHSQICDQCGNITDVY